MMIADRAVVVHSNCGEGPVAGGSQDCRLRAIGVERFAPRGADRSTFVVGWREAGTGLCRKLGWLGSGQQNPFRAAPRLAAADGLLQN